MKSDSVTQFQVRRNKMLGLLGKARELVASIDCQTDTIEQLIEQLKQASFKVLVIGEFKRGKSTFINALLGEKILPSAAKPCTAIISEVKYGAKRGATIYFKDDVKELPKGLASDVVAYIDQHRAKGNIPPLAVPLEQLKKYVTIPDSEETDEEEKQSSVESPFDHAEIRIPLDLCKDGVEIIDSPGLNENETRTYIATGYVDEADAIIFVLSCDALAGETEMAKIKDFARQGNRSIFFICNKFDIIEGDDEQETDEVREDIRTRARRKLLEYTDLKERGLYFISAKQALKARTSLDLNPREQRALEAQSGFQKMEEGLHTFLGNDRGRVKLSKPGELLLQQLEEKLPADIGNERKLLTMDEERAKEGHQKLLKNLSEVERDFSKDCMLLRNSLAPIRERLRKELSAFYDLLCKNMGNWIDAYSPENEFDWPWTTKKQIDRIVEEFVTYAKKRAEDAAATWSKAKLEPTITECCEAFQKKMDACVKELHKQIKEAKGQFYGTCDENDPMKDFNFLKAYGFDSNILGDTLRIGSSYLGGVALGTICMLISGPIGWIGGGVALIGILLRERMAVERKMKELKQEVSKQLVVAILERQSSSIEEVVKTFPIFIKLEQAVNQFEKAANRCINDVKGQAGKAEQQCRKTEQERKQRETVLEGTLRQAKSLAGKVQDLLREVNA